MINPYVPLLYFGKYKGFHNFILIDGLIKKHLCEKGWHIVLSDPTFYKH